ncbi:hypothetical protein GY45DRAFT_1439640 [Cubamyces sp. BRFM 1775]|nr:hypothetical protein GY45DRAFT_1439640 [Cubamyces sp. BRFM 1775]
MLASVTGAQYLFFLTKGDITDSFALCTATTPKVIEACMQLFKCTPEEMAMKIEAYVTTGLSGFVKAAGMKRSIQLRSEIRSKVYEGLCKALMEKGVPEDQHPGTMRWAQYGELVCRYGVALEGWTEGGDDAVSNPERYKTIAQLERLHAALHGSSPSCFWVILDDASWEAKKEAYCHAVRNGATKKQRGAPATTGESPEDSTSSTECPTPAHQSAVATPAADHPATLSIEGDSVNDDMRTTAEASNTQPTAFDVNTNSTVSHSGIGGVPSLGVFSEFGGFTGFGGFGGLGGFDGLRRVDRWQHA